MPKTRKEVWNEGFQAGQVLNSECPYPVGSPGAKEWLEGWAVGIRERGRVGVLGTPAQSWKKFLKKLLAW